MIIENLGVNNFPFVDKITGGKRKTIVKASKSANPSNVNFIEKKISNKREYYEANSFHNSSITDQSLFPNSYNFIVFNLLVERIVDILC